MKVLVLGAGSVGTVTGWALASAGHDVTLYVRPGTKARRAPQLHFSVQDRRPPNVRPPSTEWRPNYVEAFPSGGVDLVLVALKNFQVREALPLLAGNAGRADIVFFGNLWDEVEEIERALSGRYLFGFPHFGGTLEHERWFGALTRSVSLGVPRGASPERLGAASQLFLSAGFLPNVRPDMVAWLWTHFAVNAGLMSAVAKSGNPVAWARSPTDVRLALAAMREGFSVVKARGVDPYAFPGETRWVRWPEGVIVTLAWLVGHMPPFEKAASHARLDRRELLSNLDDVVRSARNAQLRTPALDHLRPHVEGLKAA